MSALRDRVLARSDLDALRTATPRPYDQIAAALNAECQPAQIPTQVTAAQILDLAPHASVLMGLLRSAAAGESVVDLAAALLSDEGTTIYADGFEPSFVTGFEVADALYNADGSEKTE